MTTVVVVSALPAVRAGLRALIESDAGLRVVREAGSVSALSVPADVVVIDVEPGVSAQDAIPLRELAPAVVFLGAIAGARRLIAGLEGRPFAYLPRDAEREAIIAAVQAIVQGLLVLDPVAASDLLFPPTLEESLSANTAVAAGANGADQLTLREGEVLQLVAEGLPNKTIARRLGISEHTVKFHVAALMAKLGAGSRTEAVHLGARRGLVSL